MGAVVGITTYLQAKNKLSPELQEVIKSAKRGKRELDQLDDATRELVKEMRQIKQAAEQNERAFRSEMEKMKREISELRSKLRALDSIKAKPQVQVDDQARRQIAAIESDLKSLDGQKAKATVVVDTPQNSRGAVMLAGGIAGGAALMGGGGLLDQIITVSQAKARYQTLTGQEDTAITKKLLDELMMVNPNADKASVIDLLTKSTLYDPKNGNAITKQALQLETIRPDMGDASEYQSAMLSMQNSWKNIKDVSRFGDTIAMIQSSSDLKGEALESILEYSPQISKFLDAPEKLAALAKEVDVWSQDKMYDALKETTLKLYNKGDLTNALKTAYEDGYGMESKAAQEKAEKEAELITKSLNSGSVADRQFAVAALMQSFGTIKDDNVRQQLLNEIGAGPGEDLNTQVFADLLKKAGEIGMADASKFNYSGKLDEQYQKVKDNDPLRDFVDAKNMLKTEIIDLGGALAEDLAPALEGFAAKVKWAKEKLDGMSSGASLAIVATTAVIVGGSLFLLGKAANRAADSLLDLALRRKKKGESGLGSDIDIDPPEKGQKKKKRRWFGRRKDDDIDPPRKLSYEEKSEQALKKKKEDETPKKKTVKERLGGMVEKAKENLPSAASVKEKLGGIWERTKSLGKWGMKKLPLIGTIAAAGYGAAEILGAENKKEAALRVGANLAGGALGGAAMGAALGSIVPGLGTAIGGAIGAALGGAGADKLFDKAKAWWNKLKPPEQPAKPPEQPPKPPAPPPPPPPPPPKPPAPPPPPPKQIPHPGQAAVTQQVKQDVKVQTNAGPVSVTMNAQGILQDVNGLVRLLHNGTVQSTIKGFILPAVEKAIVDAIQTRGGPPAPVAPAPANSLPGGGGRQPK
ncbi:hypothetical protein [Aneurinibacillus thermoaerophilus]|uniref:hypothetical protein n=1 Tax=Aneurinibacillus thermoaerophilus TaxID=143495 RepID=UPI002E24EC23|nr:hypothetical protein [Aneurinibacillus thermoaerophilus]